MLFGMHNGGLFLSVKRTVYIFPHTMDSSPPYRGTYLRLQRDLLENGVIQCASQKAVSFTRSR